MLKSYSSLRRRHNLTTAIRYLGQKKDEHFARPFLS
jgi:hypothetical protein